MQIHFLLDPVWHDALDEGLTGSGARVSRNPQLQRTYDEVIYTEKVTKELDSEGHVISTNVERGGPRASEFRGNGMSSYDAMPLRYDVDFVLQKHGLEVKRLVVSPVDRLSPQMNMVVPAPTN